MQLFDAMTITDATQASPEGYRRVVARAARTGVYDYLASEVEAPDAFKASDTVKVFRPESEVFDQASMASFMDKPITNDHPPVNVNPSNWDKYAKGGIRRVAKDGEFLSLDLAFMDGAIIADLDSGKRELSNGYSCQLDWTPGTAPDGTAYDAVQRNIRGNHVALVDKGRAGSSCAVTDKDKFAICDANPEFKGNVMTTKTITFDGLPLVTTDAGEAAINKLLSQIADMSAKAKAFGEEKEEDMKKSAAKDGQIAALEAQLADAALTPAKLCDAAKAYSLIADKAKANGVAVTDAMNEIDLIKATVTAKLGARDGWSDDTYRGAFDALPGATDTVRDVFAGNVVSMGDSEGNRIKARDAYITGFNGKAA